MSERLDRQGKWERIEYGCTLVCIAAMILLAASIYIEAIEPYHAVTLIVVVISAIGIVVATVMGSYYEANDLTEDDES